jgi:hypothetical protein
MGDTSFGRIVGALTSPTRTFGQIAERPTWLVALVVLVAVGVLSGALISGKIDWEQVTRDSLEQQGQQLSEEQLERIIDFQERFGPVMSIAGPLVGVPIIYLLVALVFMVVFKVLGGDLTFVKSLAVVVHGMLPRGVAGLLSIPVILGRDDFDFEELQDGSVLASNLAAFAPEDAGPGLMALLSSFDLFSVWAVVLLVIGYAIAARVSKGAAAGGVVGLWLIYVLGKVGLAALRA